MTEQKQPDAKRLWEVELEAQRSVFTDRRLAGRVALYNLGRSDEAESDRNEYEKAMLEERGKRDSALTRVAELEQLLADAAPLHWVAHLDHAGAQAWEILVKEALESASPAGGGSGGVKEQDG